MIFFLILPCASHYLPFSSNEMISVLMESDCWIVSQLTTLNTFQEPTHHCQLSLYKLTFQEGNMSPISGIVSQLPFEQTGLKPFTEYTWKLVHNNEVILTNTTITLEDGKLKTYACIVIRITILILCCIIQMVSFHVNCYSVNVCDCEHDSFDGNILSPLLRSLLLWDLHVLLFSVLKGKLKKE